VARTVTVTAGYVRFFPSTAQSPACLPHNHV
jgi:hypothetical protein